ncbi:hypothetical protein ACFL3S_04770 [Gemmatimonadota bacterium]
MTLLLRLLFGVSATFWLVAGALVALGVVDLGLNEGAWILGVLMLVNGVALALAGVFSLRGHRKVDYPALVLVAANAVLSVTDEIGLLDLISLLVSGTLLLLLPAGMRSRGEASR